MLAKLQQDMLAAIEKTPDDWDETELQWFLVHRAELFTAPPTACAASPITTRCGRGACDDHGSAPQSNRRTARLKAALGIGPRHVAVVA
jgi:hypothetical protein